MKSLTPKNLLLFTIFCMPLYLIKVIFWHIPSNLFELLAIISITITFLAKKEQVWEKIKEIPATIQYSVLLILFGTMGSILLNENWKIGLGILKGWFIIPILFFIALHSVFNSKSYLNNIYQVIFFSSFAVSSIALIYKILSFVTYDGRLSAFYSSPNYLAMYLAPGIIFGNYLLKNKSSKFHWLYYLTLLLMLISLYFTYSYGTWLALIMSFLIVHSIENKKSFLKYIVTFTIILFALFILQRSSIRMRDLTQNYSRSSISSRFTIWKVSFDLIKDKPIFGIGPGNFQQAYLSKQPSYPPYLEWAVPQPHNIFLAFWLQTGIFGLIGFIFLIFFIFKKSLFLLKKEKDANLIAPIFVFFIYSLLHGIVDTTYWKNDLAIIFWINIALIIYILKYTSIKSHKH